MSAITGSPSRTATARVPAALAAAGCAALLARPAFLPGRGDPTARLVVLFVVLGAIGAVWPLPRARGWQPVQPVSMRARPPVSSPALPPRSAALSALALGLAAFAVGWVATGGPAPGHPLFARSLLLNALAAVAEEAFFRRFVFGLLPPGVAVAGSAAAFALVHVTVWGWWVFPLDLAAGLLLSWQRSASGRWWVPAATHVVANALAIL